VSRKHEALAAEVDRLADVLGKLRTLASGEDGIDPLVEARTLVALDAASRKLTKLGRELDGGLFSRNGQAVGEEGARGRGGCGR
jgi:hypothetical protein